MRTLKDRCGGRKIDHSFNFQWIWIEIDDEVVSGQVWWSEVQLQFQLSTNEYNSIALILMRIKWMDRCGGHVVTGCKCLVGLPSALLFSALLCSVHCWLQHLVGLPSALLSAVCTADYRLCSTMHCYITSVGLSPLLCSALCTDNCPTFKVVQSLVGLCSVQCTNSWPLLSYIVLCALQATAP